MLGWLGNAFGADDSCPGASEVSGIPPEMLPPSVRECISEGSWFNGGDGFGPFGPWVTTADEVPDPQALGVPAVWFKRNDGKKIVTDNPENGRLAARGFQHSSGKTGPAPLPGKAGPYQEKDIWRPKTISRKEAA